MFHPGAQPRFLLLLTHLHSQACLLSAHAQFVAEPPHSHCKNGYGRSARHDAQPVVYLLGVRLVHAVRTVAPIPWASASSSCRTACA
ncbi:hypothetical protein F5141DRAFT_633359 [Pisolithus sp. B1]|nr:hypothetical protein F5141DRAFT_633359 [Pisolithus sp. B1]